MLTRREIESLSHIIYHERRAEVMLRRAKSFLEEGQLSQAFEALQTVLGDPQELLASGEKYDQAPSDSLFLDSNRLKSVRREALRIFDGLTDKQLDFYETTYGPVAADALQVARQSGSLTRLLEVARRCFPTYAGFQAVDAAATRLLDSGDARQAAQLWMSLLTSESHRERLQPGLYGKAATALFLMGETSAAGELVDEAADLVGGVGLSLSSIESAAEQKSSQLAMSDSSTRVPFGNTANNGSASGSVPYLAPAWSQPLYDDKPFQMLAEWERDRAEAELAELGVAVYPIVARGQLVTRDLNGIRACDPASGKILWKYRSTMSALDLLHAIRHSRERSTDSQLALAWTENSTLGVVTSDGHRVFAIDWLEYGAEGSGEPFGRKSPARRSNRVVCLDIPDREQLASTGTGSPLRVKPRWVAGGRSDSPDADALSGHVFLGAPLPGNDAVFVISESLRDRELNLVKLEAATGRVVWIQKLGLVEQRIFNRSQQSRELPTAVPAISGGMIVCCADSGYIVAIDAAFGEIEWLYDYGNFAPTKRFGSSRLRGSHGFRGLPSPPVIRGNSVLCMPQHSDKLHCINLQTGVENWTAARSDDEYYVAAVNDGTVATVTREGMRGLSLEDGHELWRVRIGLPSGRGVRIDNRYLLPLKAGGIATVDLKTGDWTKSAVVPSIIERRYEESLRQEPRITQTAREFHLASFGMADERVPNHVRPGNLLFHDGLVFSLGPQHLTAFPEAATILHRLRQQAADGEPVDRLLMAQLELAVDDRESATERLTQLASTSAEPGTTADRARWLLGDLLTSRLSREPSSVSPEERLKMVERLWRISTRPSGQQQALVARARWEAANASPASAVPIARQAMKLNDPAFVPIPGAQNCLVKSDAWSRRLVRKALRKSAPGERVQLQRLIEEDLQVATSMDSIGSLREFLSLYASAPEAGRVRNRLADRLVRNGRYQAAELLLLQNRDHDDAEVRAVAEVLLIALWSRLELSFEAGDALYRVSRTMGDVRLDAIRSDHLLTARQVISGWSESPESAPARERLTVNDFVSRFSGDESARRVFEDLHPLSWDVRKVRVTQHALGESDPYLGMVWKDSPHRIFHGRHSEFDILRDRVRRESHWKILDRMTGAIRGVVTMPGRVSPARSSGYSTAGHLIPVGTPAGMQAVSLLEVQDERPLWKRSFPPLEADQLLIEPGPVTPTVCVFQTRKHLFGIDPADGTVLWRRSDLDLGSGVHVDREAGLFGDEKVLVMFHADQQQYTMLATQTGETLRTGRVNVDFRYPRRVTGRHLFHVTIGENNQEKRIRIWDPLSNEMEFDEPLGDRFYSAWAPTGELALLTPDARLRVFAPQSSEVLIDTRIPEKDIRYLSSIRIFSDHSRFFVNLQRSHVAGGDSGKSYSLASDSKVPLDSVHRGLLFAISRQTGKTLWKRAVQQRSFVRIDRATLPFLVGLSRVSPKRNKRLRTLELRVLDRRTGRDLTPPQSLIQDTIVHYQLDREAGELQLHGLATRIDLEFHRNLRGIPFPEQPLQGRNDRGVSAFN